MSPSAREGSIKATGKLALFAAGALAWEVLSLAVANTSYYNRLDVVNAIADAGSRNRRGDIPFSRSAKLERIEGELGQEYSRCSSKHVLGGDATLPFIFFLDLSSNYDRSYREAFRWGVASDNSIFRLKALQLCRAVGRCSGEWWTYLNRPDMSLWDRLPSPSLDRSAEDRLQTAKDYACGLAMRTTATPVASR